MTYFELYEQALYKLNYEGLPSVDFQKMIEPLNHEIPEKQRKSPEELYDEVVGMVHKQLDQEYPKKGKIIKFVHDWIPVERELPEIGGMYTVTLYYEKIDKTAVSMAVFDPEYGKWFCPEYNKCRVVAWLPLEPYDRFDSEGKSGR